MIPDVIPVQSCIISEQDPVCFAVFQFMRKQRLSSAFGNELIGLIAVADPIKPDSAQAIRELRNMGIETVLLLTKPEYEHISSSLVRDLYSYGKDITPYLPK